MKKIRTKIFREKKKKSGKKKLKRKQHSGNFRFLKPEGTQLPTCIKKKKAYQNTSKGVGSIG